MDQSSLRKKLNTLELDLPEDLLSSFGDLVLKLEENFIRKYPPNKRDRFKSSKGTEWNKSLKNYLADLSVDLPGGFPGSNQLKDEHKIHALNALSNLALVAKYKQLAADKKIEDLSTPSSKAEPTLDSSYQHYFDKLNLLLEKLNLPLLNRNSKMSDVKSALELYFKLTENSKSPTHNHGLENGASSPEHFTNLANSPNMASEFTKHLRSMYTDDLCTLQSEIIWLTKEFSKVAKT